MRAVSSRSVYSCLLVVFVYTHCVNVRSVYYKRDRQRVYFFFCQNASREAANDEIYSTVRTTVSVLEYFIAAAAVKERIS